MGGTSSSPERIAQARQDYERQRDKLRDWEQTQVIRNLISVSEFFLSGYQRQKLHWRCSLRLDARFDCGTGRFEQFFGHLFGTCQGGAHACLFGTSLPYLRA